VTVSPEVAEALRSDRVVDITTTGRRSGEQSRIEIWFHNVDGRIFLTGLPGRRDWYANLLAHPGFTFHLKESTRADLDASARAVTDPEEKREVLERITGRLGRSGDVEQWIEHSPLVEVDLDGHPG
jgi:hypothetical protein